MDVRENGAQPHKPGDTTRRQFIKDVGIAAVSVGALGTGAGRLLAQADKVTGKKPPGKLLPRRLLGGTGAKISIIAGNESMMGTIQVQAIKLGVNYWHKFSSKQIKLIKKDGREKHYLEACIDPKEGVQVNVDRLERAIDRIGVDYVDFYKIHAADGWGGKKCEAAKEAYYKVKEQGRVKHLSASFHNYRVARKAVEEGEVEAIQIQVNPLSPKAAHEVIALAKKRNVGVIAMKTMVGGAKKWQANEKLQTAVKKYLPDNKSIAQAIIRSLLVVPGVTAVMPACYSLAHLQENLGAAINFKLTEREKQGVDAFAAAMSTDYCRGCRLCEEVCPRGVAISDILRYEMYYTAYEEPERARRLYYELPSPKRAEACDGCGECEKRCPYGLQVLGKLGRARELLA